MAGTGKTSISMTVASALKEGTPFTSGLDPLRKTFLGASFFFNHGDATRNSTVEFFTTIASCLSDIFSDHGSPIIQAIRENPGIETKSPQEQFRKLIADPLTFLDKNTFVPLQLLVVVDALDECDDNDAETFLGMLQVLGNLHQIRLRFFITSRREGHISLSFNNLPRHLYTSLKLEKVESSPSKDNDITFYLTKTLHDMSAKYDIKDGGIGNADINKLAEKSDGLFIYAVTACRFLGGSDFSNKRLRDIRLRLILDGQRGPQQVLDDIYLKVLECPDFNSDDKEVRDAFYAELSQLIGFIIVLLQPVSVDTLCDLLPGIRGSMDYYLGHLHPILNVPIDSKAPVSLIHLSFRDFILDEKRSELLPFSVKEFEMHRDIFDRCLTLMNSELRQNICCLELPGTFLSEVKVSHIEAHIPQYLRYACLHWASHLKKIGLQSLLQARLEVDGVVHVFLREKFLFWLEVMAFIGEAPAIIPIISQLESLYQVCYTRYNQDNRLEANQFNSPAARKTRFMVFGA